MDFFNGKIDATITPASIDFFAIIDPTQSHNEEDSIKELLVFLQSNDKGDEMSDNEKLRRIGIIQGLDAFTRNFDQQDELRFVELNNQLVLFHSFETNYQIILSVNLTEVKDEGVTEWVSNDIAPGQFIRKVIEQGYNDFRLHHGSFAHNSHSDEFIEILTKWWSVWLKNLQLQLIEDGCLKLYDGFKKANVEASKITPSIPFKNLFIFNTDKTNHETYGLIHDHFENLTRESKKRLLQWIQEQNHYTTTSQSFILSQVLKTVKLPAVDDSEIVYDPFKLVFNTLSDISQISGVTAGVNAGVSGVSTGISTINGYLPSWMGGRSREESVTEVHHDYEEIPSGKKQDYEFLIGKVNEEVIKKQIWLQFDDDDETPYGIVIFKHLELLFISIYERDDTRLDDPIFYYSLSKSFMEMTNLLNIQPIPHKNFYFMIHNNLDHSIETNIPNIPLSSDSETEEHINDLKYFHDLSSSQIQSQILHREIITMITPSTKSELEKLKRTKNGWWIYKLTHEMKEILIVKKWTIYNTRMGSTSGKLINDRSKILDNSTSILGSIGKDAKLWLDDYITKNEI